MEPVQLPTPFFYYDVDSIKARLQNLIKYTGGTALQPLYSIKSACFPRLLEHMQPDVSGFATSSLFECRLAREILGDSGSVHLSTVALLPGQISELAEICDYVHLNSLSQLQQHIAELSASAKCGLRINPMTDFVDDARFDPCRPYSKLGVPINQFRSILDSHAADLRKLSGIQFHNNCESKNLDELVITVSQIIEQAQPFLDQLEWINIGGGYLFDETSDLQPIREAADKLLATGINSIFFEPGKAIVGDTGYLVASVIDLFESAGKSIAVLDCSVNHVPEIFEFQYKPDVLQEDKQGEFTYQLAGLTCLSGDLFGDYRFSQPLNIGDQLVFSDVGAYMYVKATMFNGINLPSVYLYSSAAGYELIKQHDYEDFLKRQC